MATTRESIKEPLASWLYDVRHRVEWNQHAIARNRALTGARARLRAGGRRRTMGSIARGSPGRAAAPYGVLLHATARPAKEWPEENWRHAGDGARQPSSMSCCRSAPSRARARRSASLADVARARVPDARADRCHGAADCRCFVRGRRRHRAPASRRGARRAAGRDLRRQRARPDRADGARADRGAGARTGRLRSPTCSSAVKRRSARDQRRSLARHSSTNGREVAALETDSRRCRRRAPPACRCPCRR